MKITAWRIVKVNQIDSAFNGDGERIAGGRWNKIGTPLVYTAGSLALAVLETIVHLPSIELLKKNFAHIPVRFDSKLVRSQSLADLTDDWDRLPPSDSTQAIGTEWAFKRKSVVLKVPSTVIREEFNYLINPKHPNFKKLSFGRPEKFIFDPRIIE
jgi:RES domain-containing protein